MATYKSTLRVILRRLGILDQPRRSSDALAADWAALRAALPEQFLSIRLQDFLCFCSDSGIAPDHVGEIAVSEYLERLRHRRLKGSPADKVRSVVPSPAPRLHPNIAEIYRTKLANLASALRTEPHGTAALEAAGSLIDQVIVHPETPDRCREIELVGQIAIMRKLIVIANARFRDAWI
jgi:hypothetical protein